jgi:hypothetical protein
MKLHITFNQNRLTVWNKHQPMYHIQLHGRDPYVLLAEVRELLKNRENSKFLNSYNPKILKIERKVS